MNDDALIKLRHARALATNLRILLEEIEQDAKEASDGATVTLDGDDIPLDEWADEASDLAGRVESDLDDMELGNGISEDESSGAYSTQP